jgi:uncharacterized repeat protein (TIGR01451 family)
LTPTDTVTVPGTQTPGLTLDKVADKASVSTVGETITYTFTATNTGNVSLADVAITDPLPGLSALSCEQPVGTAVTQPVASLAPGGVLTCTASYAVTQADLNAGAVANTATATGTPPTGPRLTPTDTVRIPADTPTPTLARTGAAFWAGPLVPMAILLIVAGGLLVRLGAHRTRHGSS